MSLKDYTLHRLICTVRSLFARRSITIVCRWVVFVHRFYILALIYSMFSFYQMCHFMCVWWIMVKGWNTLRRIIVHIRAYITKRVRNRTYFEISFMEFRHLYDVNTLWKMHLKHIPVLYASPTKVPKKKCTALEN